MVVVVVEEPNLVERQRNDQLSTVNIDAQLVAGRLLLLLMLLL